MIILNIKFCCLSFPLESTFALRFPSNIGSHLQIEAPCSVNLPQLLGMRPDSLFSDVWDPNSLILFHDFIQHSRCNVPWYFFPLLRNHSSQLFPPRTWNLILSSHFLRFLGLFLLLDCIPQVGRVYVRWASFTIWLESVLNEVESSFAISLKLFLNRSGGPCWARWEAEKKSA